MRRALPLLATGIARSLCSAAAPAGAAPPDDPLYDPAFGWGIVDAAAAVAS